MTKTQENKLDKVFQQKVLESLGGMSLLGGMAEVAHHFKTKGATGRSLRWFLPNGIPLTHEQHMAIHGKDGDILKQEIYRKKGDKWKRILARRGRWPDREVEFDEVMKHLNGVNEEY